MSILLVFFPNPNAGDYLIEKRMIDLFKSSFPCEKIDILDGLRSKLSDIDIENYHDIVFGGGPFFDDRVMESIVIPFFGDSINKDVRIHLAGSGIYGDDCSDRALFETFRFKSDTLDFYKKIVANGGTLSCRDEISYFVMKNNGLSNVCMTGCPAWYDLNSIDGLSLRYSGSINTIVVSNPGLTKKPEEHEIRANQAIELMDYLIERFPNSKIKFTFNAGIKTKYSRKCNEIIQKYLDDKSIFYYDMSNNADMFSIYNDADLHIGFRVHSHIYCLSKGIPSILIEEDARGYGMNETFGLPHLLSFDAGEMSVNKKYVPNTHLISHIDQYLSNEIDTSFVRFNNAFNSIKWHYKNGWLKWIELIKKGATI